MEQTHGTDSWNRLMEQTHGTESWNRLTEQTQSSAEHTSKKRKENWFMNDFNHITYNDNVKLLLLLFLLHLNSFSWSAASGHSNGVSAVRHAGRRGRQSAWRSDGVCVSAVPGAYVSHDQCTS